MPACVVFPVRVDGWNSRRENTIHQGTGFTGCGKSAGSRRNAASAAKAGFISKHLRTA
jgi:hypothetical protein